MKHAINEKNRYCLGLKWKRFGLNFNHPIHSTAKTPNLEHVSKIGTPWRPFKNKLILIVDDFPTLENLK